MEQKSDKNETLPVEVTTKDGKQFVLIEKSSYERLLARAARSTKEDTADQIQEPAELAKKAVKYIELSDLPF